MNRLHSKSTFVLSTFVLFLLFLAGCKPAEEKARADVPLTRVSVEPVKLIEYKVPVRATGLLGTTTEMKLSFKTGGIIKEIYVKEGRPVHRGDVLAVLDLSEVQAQVNQAKIGMEKAERDLTRAGNLYRDSVVTLEQFQNARSAYELAKSRKQIADFNLQHSRIEAPSEGKIQKILVETNEVCGPGIPAILFASTENDWVVRASLTDKDVVKFSIGDSAKITMDAFPDTEFKAEITELGTVADPVTGTYESELLILHAHPQFRTGFISRVEIFPTRLSHSLVVPIEALQDANDRKAHVFVYQEGESGLPGVARKRAIKIGLIHGDNVVIKEGLSEGELIIAEGARYLKPDDEVIRVSQAEKDQI